MLLLDHAAHERVELTHLDETGAARMVDVSGKDVTARTRRRFGTGAGLRRGRRPAARRGRPQGRRARRGPGRRHHGRQAHPGPGAAVPPAWRCPRSTVDLQVEDDAVAITATVRTTDRTGVEMEALTAVSVAGAHRRRHGQGRRQGRRDHRRPGRGEDRRQERDLPPMTLAGAAVVVVRRTARPPGSTTTRPARSSSRRCVPTAGRSATPVVVPDGERGGAGHLRGRSPRGRRAVLTTGGTGLTPTDRTPEVTRALLDREVPGHRRGDPRLRRRSRASRRRRSPAGWPASSATRSW